MVMIQFSRSLTSLVLPSKRRYMMLSTLISCRGYISYIIIENHRSKIQLGLLFVTDMASFKEFVQEKIQYYIQHFRSNAPLLETDGTPLLQINLSFNHLTDQYLNLETTQLSNTPQTQEMQTINIQQNQLSFHMRITDKDLEEFWEDMDPEWGGELKISDQNIGDETVFKIANLLVADKCQLRTIHLNNNKLISGVSIASLASALTINTSLKKLGLKGLNLQQGANRVIELVQLSKNIREYDFGIIGNQNLIYLSKQLLHQHCVEHLAFGQSNTDKWKQTGKEAFNKSFRSNSINKQIVSVTLYPEQPEDHYQFIAELSLLCSKNREMKVKERENDFKSKSLNPDHPKYYDPDNHSLNAYKFSVKSYLNNVFESMLDEGLYFLEKQRRNSLREDAIFNVTRVPTNKQILQDICTSDGSIMVLAEYLLKKIDSK